jgi:hypothetical protein
MKVKCIKNYLTDEEKKLIGMSLDEYSVYNITEGCRYTVLAISFMYEQYGVLLDLNHYQLKLVGCDLDWKSRLL